MTGRWADLTWWRQVAWDVKLELEGSNTTSLRKMSREYLKVLTVWSVCLPVGLGGAWGPLPRQAARESPWFCSVAGPLMDPLTASGCGFCSLVHLTDEERRRHVCTWLPHVTRLPVSMSECRVPVIQNSAGGPQGLSTCFSRRW